MTTDTSTSQTIIDVRKIVPREPQVVISRIFSSFQALRAGAAIELVNDHDPKPVFHRLQAEHPGRVTWQYLEQGPDVWRVRVGKSAEGDCGGRCTCN